MKVLNDYIQSGEYRRWLEKRAEIENRKIIRQKKKRDLAMSALESYKKHSTLALVAAEWGCTRQCVDQVMRQFPETKDYKKFKKSTRKIGEFVCQNKKCEKTFKKPYSTLSKNAKIPMFCGRKCFGIASRVHRTKEELREMNRIRTNAYYHKHLSGTEEFKKLTKKRNKLYAKRIKEDPKRLARVIKQRKNAYKKMKSDPVKWAAFLKKCRERNAAKMKDPEYRKKISQRRLKYYYKQKRLLNKKNK